MSVGLMAPEELSARRTNNSASVRCVCATGYDAIVYAVKADG